MEDTYSDVDEIGVQYVEHEQAVYSKPHVNPISNINNNKNTTMIRTITCTTPNTNTATIITSL